MQVHWALDDDDDDVGGAGQWSGHGSDHSDDVGFPKSFSSTSALTSVISSDSIWFNRRRKKLVVMKETQLAIINNTISVSSIKTKLDLF